MNARTASYTPNLLNQYSERAVPGAFDVIGSAKADAHVTVNLQSVSRKGEYFHRSIAVDNTTEAVSRAVCRDERSCVGIHLRHVATILIRHPYINSVEAYPSRTNAPRPECPDGSSILIQFHHIVTGCI